MILLLILLFYFKFEGCNNCDFCFFNRRKCCTSREGVYFKLAPREYIVGRVTYIHMEKAKVAQAQNLKCS